MAFQNENSLPDKNIDDILNSEDFINLSDIGYK